MAEDAAAAARVLQEHGERFLAMFEETPKPKNKANGSKKGLQVKAGGNAEQQTTVGAGKAANGKHKSKGTTQLGSGFAAAIPTAKGTSKLELTLAVPRSPAGSPSGTKAKTGNTKGIKRPRDDIDQILINHRNQLKSAAKSAASGTPDRSRHTTPVATGPADKLFAKRQRQLFMSSKASRVHEDVDDDNVLGMMTPGLGKGDVDDDDDDDMHLDPEEFKALQQEVERLGASALDKRERKKWQAAMLTRIGARPEKAPRRAASIGKGLATVNAARDARKLEEAMQAGMVKRKGSGKKKKREQARTRERGLDELGPGYKAGVLKLKGSSLGGGDGGSGGKSFGGSGGKSFGGSGGKSFGGSGGKSFGGSGGKSFGGSGGRGGGNGGSGGGRGGKRGVNTGATRAALHKTKGLGGMRPVGMGKKKGKPMRLPF